MLDSVAAMTIRLMWLPLMAVAVMHVAEHAQAMVVLDRPRPQLGYCTERDGERYESHLALQTVTRPVFDRTGKRLYGVIREDSPPDRWKAAMFDVKDDSYLTNWIVLDYGRRRELGVLPSPDGQRLLLLLEAGETARLAVSDTSASKLDRFERGLDPQRSQYAWSSDSEFVYYSRPVESGDGMALKRGTRDGKTVETLIERGVVEFDAARAADRVVALVDGTLHVLAGGKAVQTFEPEGPIAGVCISPDGTRVAWGGRRIVVFDLEQGKVVAASSPPADAAATDRKPSWSGDGSQIVFERAFHLGGLDGIVVGTSLTFWQVGSNVEQQLETTTLNRSHIVWSPSGGLVAYDFVDLGAELAASATHHEPSELVPAADGAAWTAVTVPSGGHVVCYAVAPSDGRVVYAGRRNGDLYVTQDAGEHWQRVEVERDKGFEGPLTDLAVDAQDSRVVYAATGAPVWRSKDGGKTWSRFGPDARDRALLSIVVHPTEPGVVYGFWGGRRLSRYTAEGIKTISELKEPMGLDLSIDPHNPELLTLGGPHRWKRVELFSTNGGRSWRSPAPPQGEGDFLFLAANPGDKTTLLARAQNDRVFFSTDEGESWELFADPDEPALWSEATRTVCRAAFPLPAPTPEDGWPGEAITAVRDTKDPKRIYMMAGELGIVRSDDGGATWAAACKGLGTLPVRWFAVARDRGGHVVVSGARSLVTRDDGKSWSACAMPDGDLGWFRDMTAHPSASNVFFFSSVHAGVCRSTDRGAAWECIVGDYREYGIGSVWHFGFDPNDSAHVRIYGEGGVLESHDVGETWTVASKFDPLPRKFHPPQIVGSGDAITMCERGNWRLFQSRDLGKTWRALDGPFAGWRTMVLAGRLDEPNTLYLVTEYDWETKASVLWVSKDLGDTWEARPLPKRFAHATALATDPAFPGLLAIGFESGNVWLSLDDGAHWRDLGSGLPATMDVEALEFSPADRRLYACLKDAGLFWIKLPERP
ncbi:MAG: hypothetical protein JW889_08455 [Verrucomicrobia bacterium]|nr:hypothetical protein [Verrucomicrobiota bacterium]